MDFKRVISIFTLLIVLTKGSLFSDVLGSVPGLGQWFGTRLVEEWPDRVVIPIGSKEGNMLEGRVMIGKSKDTYHLIFGTSFSGMWVFSKTACAKTNNLQCENIRVYDDGYVQDKEKKPTFSLNYVDGKVSGYVIKETIVVGNKELKDQDLGVATDWDETLTGSIHDGYIGIQFFVSSGKTIGTPFFHDLYQKKIIKELIFGVYINLKRGEGQLMLGGTNDNFIDKTDNLVEIKTLEGSSTWFLELKSLRVGDKEIGKNLKVLVDPANSNLAGKKELIDKINNEIGGTESQECAPMVLVNCDTINTLPSIVFEFEGKTCELDGNNYIWKAKYFIAYRCYSFFYTRELEDYDLVIGAPFLTKFYSKFDVNSKTIGFIKANHK